MPPVVDVVLVGGGHSHVQVLRSFGMRPLPGARVTIVSREVFTPYSGMLPGHVAGRYGWRDVHMDLGPLARFAAARLLHDEVVALDAERRTLTLRNRPPLPYDLLSINCGAVPAVAQPHGVAVKPIGRFLPRWRELAENARPGERVTLVGGGAGGVELALAARRALPPGVEVSLVTEVLLAGLADGARVRLRAALAAAGVAVHEGFQVRSSQAATGAVTLYGDGGRELVTRHLFWVTGVEAPSWLRQSGLTLADDGFVEVDRQLRSTSHHDVFAAGDVAALKGQPRPKSGVFAVREGPVLATNLRRAVRGRPLVRYRAQRRALALIGTADGRAVACRGRWWAAGRWVWWWKDQVDRRFMRRFSRLGDMARAAAAAPDHVAAGEWRRRLPEAMRCGGCGAKLGADPLARALRRLPPQQALERSRGVVQGIGDDAALLRVDSGRLILTVDGFRSLLDDAYLFGRITAHHALNDVFAMGGEGIAALAMATVPLMAESMMEEELYLLLKGAVDVLNSHGVPLIGGHSAEGNELALALSLTGASPARPLRKSGLQDGDVLLLTKPLGTGALLAAHMRARLASDRLAAALASMDQSNAAAVPVLTGHGVSALTDVSGFGLLGHLGEMLRASAATGSSGLGAVVRAGAVPLLDGAVQTVAGGIVSSLQASNERVLADFGVSAATPMDPTLRLLADPQTSGGLLAGVPAGRADACLEALRDAGFATAAVIGSVAAGPSRIEP